MIDSLLASDVVVFVRGLGHPLISRLQLAVFKFKIIMRVSVMPCLTSCYVLCSKILCVCVFNTIVLIQNFWHHARNLYTRTQMNTYIVADCTKNVFSNVTYVVPTCRTNEEFDPKKAAKFYKCACKSTKVDGKCMFNEQCKKEATIYKVEWIPTSHTYIGKSQGNLSKRINQGHINCLVAYWNLRDKYNKNIA